jgi:hypothetical protein
MDTPFHAAIIGAHSWREKPLMNNIIWIVGAIVIVLFILGYLGFG